MNDQFQTILSQFNEIFIEVLDNEDIVLKPETTANDIEEWGSLKHILLIVDIEKHFKIKFTAMEVDQYQNVGEMCQAVAKKLNLQE